MSSLFPCSGRLYTYTQSLDASSVFSFRYSIIIQGPTINYYQSSSQISITLISYPTLTYETVNLFLSPQSSGPIIIKIMENELIKERIQGIWNAIKSSKAGELERHLDAARERVTEIIGSNEIQKIRHSSLLKLLVYELIVFADEKTSPLPSEKSTARSGDSSRSTEKGMRALQRLGEIKELVCAMSQSTSGELRVELSKFKSLLQRIKSLQRELQRQDDQRRRASLNSSDSQGTELMIQQLEDIIRRKQNRIKELNIQLEENFNDKQLLEEEIDHLELSNCELEARVRQTEGNLSRAQLRNHELEKKLAELGEEFEQFKHKEKEELLFGVSSFMNSELPIKRQVGQETTLNNDPLNLPPEPITNSTKVLYQYFQPEGKAFEEQTVKKKAIKVIQSEEEQDDLLISIRPPSPPSPLVNTDQSLERMLLMQALFIQRALQDMSG